MKNLLNKVKRAITNFLKAVWTIIKSVGSIRGVLALFISFMIFQGWAYVFIVLGAISGNAWLLSVGTTVTLFWLGPFTPLIPIVLGVTVFIQKYILLDKKAISKEEILKSFKNSNP